jgi:hypothetical protein
VNPHEYHFTRQFVHIYFVRSIGLQFGAIQFTKVIFFTRVIVGPDRAKMAVKAAWISDLGERRSLSARTLLWYMINDNSSLRAAHGR